MSRTSIFFPLLCLFGLASSAAWSATTVSGTVSGRWYASSSPYRVTGEITVPSTATLYIEPGVEVLFDADVAFLVEGLITIAGSAGDSVRFLPGDTTRWKGMRISGGNASSIAFAHFSGGVADDAAPGGYGGAIGIDGPATEVTISHSVISGNSAVRGGGGLSVSGGATATLTDCAIWGNTADFGGGIIAQSNSSVTLADCSVFGNTSSTVGGGLFVQTGSYAALTGTEVRGNSAANGGGVHASGSNIDIAYSAIVDNAATVYGGGLYLEGATTTVSVRNGTIAENQASGGAGVYASSSSATTMTNSIVYGNGPDEILEDGGTVTATYSDVRDGYAGTGNLSLDPQFYAAASGNFHIRPTSPCVDSGDPNAAFDPDGTRADMGAFPMPGNPVSGDMTTTTWTKAMSPYRVTGPTTVLAAHRLTVEPGVRVLFDADVSLNVLGTISAVGAPNDTIRFEKGAAGKWRGISVQGGTSNRLSHVWVRDVEQASAVFVSNTSTRLDLDHTLIADNGGQNYATGLEIAAGAVVNLTNCTITANGGTGIVNSGVATLRNSVVWGNSSTEIWNGGATTVTYSDVEGGFTGVGNLNADPLFASTLSRNYALQPGSPCINSGDPSSSKDADGTRVDMGAFAFDQTGEPTIVSGLRMTETWTKANSPYHVTGAITVAEGDTLTIEPGVEVLFDVDVPLRVPGVINAVGAAGDTISFRAGSVVRWGGISITGSGAHTLSYLRIADAQVNGAALDISGANTRVDLSHAVIAGNMVSGGMGVYIHNSASATLTNCTIANNASYGVYVASSNAVLNSSIIWESGDELYTPYSTVSVSYSDIQENWTGDGNLNRDPQFADAAAGDYRLLPTSPCINAGDPSLGPDPDGTRADMGARAFDETGGPTVVSGLRFTETWAKANSPYHVTGTITVAEGDTLTVEPGVEVLFDADVPMNVLGVINAVGAAGDTIDFRAGAAQRWGGMSITGDALHVLSHVRISDIRLGGTALNISGANTRANVSYALIAGTPTSGSNGVTVFSGATVTLTRSTIVDNNSKGVYVSNSSVTLDGCVLWGNTDQIYWSSGVVTAKYSDIQENWTGEGNLNEDPQFVDAAAGDYRLLPTSPCINAGDPSLDPDPDGSRSDMGAFPFDEIGGPTVVSGLRFTETWAKANSPYHVTGTITVAQGDTLTVEPGVEVLFDADVPMKVQGILTAVGASGDTIRFRAGAAQKWGGISVTGSGAHIVSYTRISQAVTSGAALSFDGPSTRADISHTVIAGNNEAGSDGLHITGSAISTITQSTIADNTNYGIFVNGTATINSVIAWGNGSRDIYRYAGIVTVRYSDVGNGLGYPAGVGNLQKDPLFVNAALGDYRLQGTSPCINAGDPDLEREPDSSRADMGGFSYLTASLLRLPDIEAYPGLTVEIPITATLSNAFGADLAFLANASVIDSVYVVSHAFQSVQDAYGEAGISGDTIFVSLASPQKMTLVNDTLVTLAAKIRPGTPIEIIPLQWAEFPKTDVEERAALLDGRLWIGRLLYGDVSGDSTLSAVDAAQILEYRVRKRATINRINGDVTGNGSVTHLDAALILYKVLNPDYVFPVTGGVLPKPAHLGTRTVRWEKDGEGWRLVADNPAGILAGEIAMHVPAGVSVRLVSSGMMETNTEGGVLRAAFVHDGGDATLFRLDAHRPLSAPPKLLRAELNEEPASVDAANIPALLVLSQNAPNPFNPTTTIRFALPVAGPARLVIYSTSGQVVAALVDGNVEAGYHAVVWDGRDAAGRPVSSGVYICRLTYRRQELVRRMVLAR